jgi:hypothetical protein
VGPAAATDPAVALEPPPAVPPAAVGAPAETPPAPADPAAGPVAPADPAAAPAAVLPVSDPPPPIILTAGDVSIDWLWFELCPDDERARRKEWEGCNSGQVRRWTHRPQVVNAAVHGGAWYLDSLARQLAGWRHEDTVFGYERYVPDELRRLTNDTFIHIDTGFSYYEYEPGSLDPKGKSPRGVYRVRSGPTFSGPADLSKETRPALEALPDSAFRDRVKEWDDERALHRADESPPPPKNLPAGAYPADRPTVLLLHDEGNGFAQDPARWESFVTPPAGAAGPKVAAVVINLTSRESILGILADKPARAGRR